MDYEEGLKLGLSEYEIEDLPNMDNRMLALIIEGHPGCVSFIKSVLEQNGKTLDIKGIVDELVDGIDNPYFDPDYGYEDVDAKKRAIKELGSDYDEIKQSEIEEDIVENDEFEINEFGEIVRPSLENTENHVSKQSKKIDEELEQWLNGGQSQTPLQKREKELSKLQKEEKTISEAEKLIDQKEKDGQSK